LYSLLNILTKVCTEDCVQFIRALNLLLPDWSRSKYN